jgi:serine/threonine protein kinase
MAMDRIGKYKIEGLIGEGGFGRVYRAYDPTVNRTVAIKVVRIEDRVGEEQLLTRFRSEAKTTGTLLHKNVVTVYDYGEQDGLPYLVMEYLQGRDLEHIIENNEPLSLAEKVSLMKQAGEGLQYAHAKGIVHRDVKPANIMVLNDGGVKLMDFGIARLLQDQSTRMTQQGRLIGTFAYMSPEQFEGKDVDCLTDIFAYGVIYYHLLTGQHPFRGRKGSTDLAVLIRNVTSLEPAPICERVPECPPALEQIILKAIHKNRQQRYQSIDDLLLDVAPLLIQLEADLAEQKTKDGEKLLAEGKAEDARSIVREALRLAPGSRNADILRKKIQQHFETRVVQDGCESLLNKGREEFEVGNYANAIEAFKAAQLLNPLNVDAGQLLKDAMSAEQRLEHANVLLEQTAREIAADNLSGAIPIADQFFEETLRLLSDLNIVYPAHKIHELTIAAQKAQEEHNRRQRMNQELTLARQKMSEKAWIAASSILRSLAAEYPGNKEVEILLSETHEGLKSHEKVDAIGKIVKEVQVLIIAEQFDSAVSLVIEGLKSFPNDSTLLKANARITYTRRQCERRLAIKQSRTSVIELSAAKRYSEALTLLEKTIRIWEAQELSELREQIKRERQIQETGKAIADGQLSIRHFIELGKSDEALSRARQFAQDYPDEPSFNSLIASIETQISEKKGQ